MKVRCYPDGCEHQACDYNLSPFEAAGAFCRDCKDRGSHDIIVEPLDDAAKSMPGWHKDDDAECGMFRMFKVSAHVQITWTVKEVDTFNPYYQRP
jgi:hypothetical protein